MKKVLIISASVICLALSFFVGMYCGVMHAMCDSEYFILETDYSGEELPSNADFRIWTILDGHSFENYGYIG